MFDAGARAVDPPFQRDEPADLARAGRGRRRSRRSARRLRPDRGRRHAHALAYRAAIAAKGAGGVALVSDAMPPAAGGPDAFELHGRRMTRVGLKLVDENGTLAGAAITLRDAVRYVVKRSACRSPRRSPWRRDARAPPRPRRPHRPPRAGPEADLVHFTDALDVAGVWMSGRAVAEVDGGRL